MRSNYRIVEIAAETGRGRWARALAAEYVLKMPS